MIVKSGRERSDSKRDLGAKALLLRGKPFKYKSRDYNNRQSYFTGEEKEIDWDVFLIKGTSQELEKQYLRLTAVMRELHLTK